MSEIEDDSEEGGGNQNQVELLRSYLAFGKRAIRLHWRLCTLIGIVGLGLTVAAVILAPRTYKCTTVLMAVGTPVLDGATQQNPLASADGLILRHENLEALIRDTNLLNSWETRRPPLLKFKDKVMRALRGELDTKTKISALVGTLETKIVVTTEKNNLTIAVEWSDAQTAADLALAAREGFVRSRRAAEMSAFEDRAAILDSHASSLRDEVQSMAEQLMAATRQGIAKAEQSVGATAVAATPAATPKIVGSFAARPASPVTEEVSALRERLAADKPKVVELENDWQRRLREEQGKLADLKLKFTDSHPQVVTEQERLAMLSQPPPELATLKAEIKAIEQDIRARELITGRKTLGMSSVAGAPAATLPESLPPAIMQALENDGADPALRAQLSRAVVQYGDLRGEMRMDRIALDTAQAAFNHRYQVNIPADVPPTASKPKPGVIVAAGLVLSLLLAAGIPLLLELRRRVLVERWQVNQLQLPVLAELKLPRRTS